MLKPTDLIPVGRLPTPRDFEIASLLGWYRIPLRTASTVVALDQLAFYQPSTFGGRRTQTKYIAQVRGDELTTRDKLLKKDEANQPSAKKEYSKIQIGALEKLKEPVKSDKWKRLTFFYTTWEYLLIVKSLNDLVVDGDESQPLWRSLRERSENELLYKTDLPEADIPPDVMIALLEVKEMQEPYDAKEGSNGNFD